jgi:hypothetical protein
MYLLNYFLSNMSEKEIGLISIFYHVNCTSKYSLWTLIVKMKDVSNGCMLVVMYLCSSHYNEFDIW